MAEEEDEKEDNEKPQDQAVSKDAAVGNSSQNKSSAESGSVLEKYFSNGNKLLTLSGSDMAVNDDTRRLLALFTDGRFLVVETHRFDGRVLSFEVLARKKKLPIQKPTYVSQNELNSIYAVGERAQAADDAANDEDLDKVQMLKDFVNVVIRAASVKTSDVHVVVADSTTILFRSNGMMKVEMEYSKEWGESFVRAAFASADISDSNYSQNEFQGAQKLGATPLRGSKGKLMLPHNVLAIRMQFNPIAFGSQYLVMRLLYAEENPESSGDLAPLGFTEMEQDLFYRLRAVPVGLSIVAGPTGSGKSTTLQRNMIKLLQEKNYELNLLTVEDPPEYPIPGARQMPVTNANTEEEKAEQFTKALSAALRSDPDVIMVGEIRALASAQLTFQGALSGHGMWSTLHANSAPAILNRFRDMGVETFKLLDPELIKGLISQRLFRKLCPHCRVSVKERPNDPSFNRLRIALGDFGVENTFIRGPGCKACNGTGVKGRMCVPEIVLPDAVFLEMMIKGETKRAIDYWTADLGGRTLKEAAMERMLKGFIDLDEVERWCGLLDQRPAY
ncbi:MAG: Flp pilus assembly complex ATPase component TadA [Alphaproteobacteria bacterium]|nr:Flp pilus assembly complex ATPase component TadA [Alphaproteobacteria bacterium]